MSREKWSPSENGDSGLPPISPVLMMALSSRVPVVIAPGVTIAVVTLRKVVAARRVVPVRSIVMRSIVVAAIVVVPGWTVGVVVVVVVVLCRNNRTPC